MERIQQQISHMEQRALIFRAKRRDNKEWVYGSLIDKNYILQYIDLAESWTPLTSDQKVTCRSFEIIPETVGQKSGHELVLYEGDIVNYVTGNPSYYVNAFVEFGEYETYTTYNKEEGDVEKHFGFYINDGKGKIPLGSLWLNKIGNKWDNPELLQSL